MTQPVSGDWCECSHCGFTGYCYGVPFIGGGCAGVSAPFCTRCGCNDTLRKVQV